MSAEALPLSCLNLEAKYGLDRHIADYHPSIWKDFFLQYASDSMEFVHNFGTQIETLKEEVRKMLVLESEKPLTKVHLIDSICRLGVNRHFKLEIFEVLKHVHMDYVENGKIILEDNLQSLAMLFRLLRQHGFHVSPNVFNKFKDEQGNFSERLITNFEGMLNLYEASHVRIHGEQILEEALAFTSTHLESIITQLSPSFAAQVNHSLRQSLHKNLPRLEAHRYISIYQQDSSHNEVLLTFAKLDFNMLQILHQNECGNICKWWKELDIPKKLPFTRDRIVEGCFWILAIYFEPEYSQAREIVTKVMMMVSIIDDIYDAYGTIDELELFTEAIDRWDISNLDNLPDYMKLSYRSLMMIYQEIEEQMKKEGRTFCLNYAIKELKRVNQAQMTEARWLNNNYMPTTDEYLHTSTISCGYILLTTLSYIGMGDAATEDIFEWVTNLPKIVEASCVLCRLMNDIVSSEFEQKRGHVCSFLECYMKEYGVSKDVAIDECRRKITIAWKDINEESLRLTNVPNQFLMSILNQTRFLDVCYKDVDNYTNSGGVMKGFIKALLVDPIPI
ncbi:hypothetical protein VNO77_37155 [Canavalia gladiata]|uniref:Uncharacterized protein n=1 Tax=Canavalia gladiata TaxID=3824 RepID=A0AAN9KAT8_CANGL